MPLPRVTWETGEAVKREVEQADEIDFVVQLMERLEVENPCVAEFISRIAKQHPDPTLVSTAALLVYRLLESQTEANELKRQLEM